MNATGTKKCKSGPEIGKVVRKFLPALVLGAVLLPVVGCGPDDARRDTTRRNGSGPETTATDAEPGAEHGPVAVRTVRPLVRDVEHRLSYIGTVRSRQEVKVIARVGGTVAALPFREGDRISRGDILVRLEAPEIRAQVERLEAERDYWLRRHEADRRLVEKNALAPEQADSSERAWRTAAAALAEAESQLNKTVEAAPFEGEVLSWFAEPGQSVMPGQPLLLIGDNRLEVRADVVEEDLRRGVTAGTPVDLLSGAADPVRSRVSEIAPTTSGPARTFTVKIPFPADGGGSVRKGSSLRVEFILGAQREAVTVPVNAVADRDGNPHIFLVRDDRAVRQDVRLGIEQDGYTAVSFPWNGEDPVVVTNIDGLRDGVAVYAVEDEEANG